MDFLIFMCFWIFDIKARKRLIRNNNVKTFKANSKQTEHATQIANKVMYALQKIN